MKEEAIRFAENDRLCGIVAHPDVKPDAERPAVVFVSAGLLPKSGPYRMYTDFARSLASLGFTTLRIDLSGNGDSRGALTAENAEQTSVADTRIAMDELEARYGVEQFVLFGLCSGAETAHRTALIDRRVAGVVALDGFIARTPKFYLYHYLPRVFSFIKWRSWLGLRLQRFLRRADDGAVPRDDSVEFWDDRYPSRDALAADYRELCSRGVRQLMVYSGGSRNCSYKRQFHDAFHDVHGVELVDAHFFREADHTYVLREDRRALHQLVSHWFRTRFLNCETPVRPPVRARRDVPDNSVEHGLAAVSFYGAGRSATHRSEETR